MLIFGPLLWIDTLRRKKKFKRFQKLKPNIRFKKIAVVQNQKTGPKLPYSVIEQFFDFNKECPAIIKNCKEFRALYMQRVKENEKIFKICSECDKNFIKSFIIDKLTGTE